MQMIRCMKCMAELEEGMKVCPHCGYDQDKEPQPSNGLRRNTILCGRYLVGKVIGQGGFGITYVGYDLTLEMKVAIKEYFPSGSAIRTGSYSSSVQWEFGENGETQWSEGMERFLKEARRMARLDSVPAVVRVRDVFRENQTAYIVMDFVEGDNLKHYLMSHGVLSFERCMRLLTPILDSLAVIHDSGFIHRDISPDNIMLQPDGTARLLDMGAAVDVRATQGHASMVVVKRNFSAPEQYLESEPLGSWTDVYAMAATMYYCLTGKVVPEAIEREFKKTPLYFNPELKIPEAAVRAITAGLELKAENRIRDMREFKRQLMLSKGSAVSGAAVQTVAASVTTGQATATQAAASQVAAAQTGTSGKPAVDPVHATGTPPASAVQAAAVQTSAAAQRSAAQTPTMAQASKAAQAAVPRAAAGTPSDSAGKRKTKNYKLGIAILAGIALVVTVFVWLKGGNSSYPERTAANIEEETTEANETENGLQYKVKDGEVILTGYVGEDDYVVVPKTFYEGEWKGQVAESFPGEVGLYIMAEEEELTWETLEDGTGLELTGYSGEQTGTEHLLALPGEIGGKAVKAVGYAFMEDNETIAGIVFPEGLERIGWGAFRGCSQLKAVVLPKSLKKIGNMAFSWAPVEHLRIPASLETYESGAFDGVKTIEVDEENLNFKVEGNVLYSGERLLLIGTENTGDFLVPEDISEIGFSAGKDSRLNSIVMSGNVKRISSFSFCNAQALRKVVMSEGTEEIGMDAFYNCISLEEVRIPKTVKRIESYAFEGCSSLKSVTVSRDCQIAEDAFDEGVQIQYYEDR